MGEAALPEVLLVEDESLICRMIEVALTEAGFSVHTFSNGRDALGYLAAGGHADVLFTDIDLGGDIDGVELARQSRALDAGIGVRLRLRPHQAQGPRARLGIPAEAVHPRPGLRRGRADGRAPQRGLTDPARLAIAASSGAVFNDPSRASAAGRR